MGFEIFILGFKKGGPEWFPEQLLRDAFGTHVVDRATYSWGLHYSELDTNGVTLMKHPSELGLVQGFSLDSPGSDIRLWDTLASILSSGPFALVFSSGHPPLIGNLEVSFHLPPDMVASMGQPRLVRNGQEILDQIRTSRPSQQ